MLAGHWQDVLGEGLAVTLDLSLAASTRPVMPDEAAVHLLDAIAILEDGVQGHGMEDSPPPEFQRLEAKIDLLLQMLSTWLQQRLPERASVTMSADGLVLPAELLPEAVDRIELYLSDCLTQPLVMQVTELRRVGGMAGLCWGSTDRALRDAMSRWVFRMHRRDVARRRRQGTSSTTTDIDSTIS